MKKKWVLLKIVVLFGILISLLAFSKQRYDLREIKEIKTTIDYSAGNHFITPSIIDTLLHKTHKDYPHMQMKRVDTQKMERLLNQDEFISSANVYLENDGELHAVVEQEVPAIRVHKGKEEFYICQDGKRIPLSDKFSAKVFIVDGNVMPDDYKGLIELNNLIQNDKLLRNIVVGIHKEKNNSFILLVEDDHYVVELGPLENLKDKLKDFKVFHKKYVEKVQTVPYKRLNLRFNHQIVAIK